MKNPSDELEDRPLTRLLSRRSAALVGATALATLGIGAVAVPAAFAAGTTPTVTTVTPSTGPVTGDTPVTIDGTNFVSGASVDFGTAAATDVTVVSATEITADSPATSASGTVDVTVIDSDGMSTSNGTVGTNAFAYDPVISSISPTSGSSVGTNTVTLTGAGLGTVKAVSFGGKAGTMVTVVSDDEVTAVAPAETAGDPTVAVTATDSSGDMSNAIDYTYSTAAPTVTAVTPASGSYEGGQTVTVTGTNLTGATAVDFGGTAASDIKVNGAGTSLTVTTPAESATAGTVNVTVTTPNGTSAVTTADDYTVEDAAPTTLTSVTPSTGPEAGGTPVVLIGNGFTGATSVDFGTVAATDVTVVSPSEITADAPASTTAGEVTVTVTSPDGAASLADGYDYTAAAAVTPTVTAVSPAGGSTSGGQVVTITGTGFTDVTSVAFGTAGTDSTAETTLPTAGLTMGEFYVVSPTEIEAVSPADTTGLVTVDVTVANSAGTSTASTAGQYTYSTDAQPVVSNVTPDTGSAAGGTAVTITGSGFVTGATVDFGGVAATAVTVVSSTEITATSPADATTAGGNVVNVTVTTPGGQSASVAGDDFTYAAVAPPTVTAVSPSSGTEAGGTLVTIGGTNFVAGDTVDFATAAATDVTVVSPTEITAVSPAGTGTVNVTVVDGTVTSATSTADDFTYTPAVAKPTLAVTSRTGRGDVSVTGTGTAGTPVDLYIDNYDTGSYTEYQTGTISTAGTYSFTSYIRKSAYFFVEDSGVKSAVVRSHVNDDVSLSLTGGTKKVTVRVSTNPTVSGVRVTLERELDGSTIVKGVDLTNSSGDLTKTLTITTTGSTTIKAIVAGGDGSYGGTSAAKTVTVKS